MQTPNIVGYAIVEHMFSFLGILEHMFSITMVLGTQKC